MLFTSQVIASASGSAGGLVASRNRYGMYFRARTVPVNPSTPFQQTIRALFAQMATRWSTLTAEQRVSWDVYASNTEVTNRLGQAVTLTGFTHYVRSNVPRLQGGLPVVDAGPTTFGLPTFTSVDLQPAVPAGVPTVSVPYTNTDQWANETDGGLLISISRPFSPTIGFFAGPFRFLDTVLGDDVTPPTSPFQSTVPPFPFVVGQQLAIQVRATLVDGRLSSAQIDRALVA